MAVLWSVHGFPMVVLWLILAFFNLVCPRFFYSKPYTLLAVASRFDFACRFDHGNLTAASREPHRKPQQFLDKYAEDCLGAP